MTTFVQHFKPTHLDTDRLPWHPFTPYSDQVEIKLLHVDYVTGQTILMLRAPAGANLGRHNHYGTVQIYTVTGSWGYAEHDWVAQPGDFVYEVANTQHTFVAEPGDDVVVFIVIEGALEFLDENDNRVGMETAHTFARRYEKHCAEHGIEPVDLTQFSLH